jgi:hypothetical protein
MLIRPYLKVKEQLNTEMKAGYLDNDFRMDYHTIRPKIRFKHLAYIALMKIADEVEDEPFIKAFKEMQEDKVARTIWRLNDKRVRHGIPSWID